MTFAAVLPAYRDTFTAAVTSADFAVDVAGCDCTTDDVSRLSQLPGVTRVVPVLGINDIPIRGPRGEGAAFAWVLDDAAGGSSTPIGPAYLVDGSFDLGSAADPRVVLDRDTSNAVGAQVGDLVTIRLAGQEISLRVTGVAGSAGRFRGASMSFARFVIEPLLPVDSPLRTAPYTELLVAGTVEGEAVHRLFLGRKVIVYSKAEHLEILEAQIEVSQPVITVVSIAAVVALAGFSLLLALFATERRRAYLRLLPALGASVRQSIANFVVLEAMPTALAMAVGAMIALGIIVNTYFAQISVHVDLDVAVFASAAIGFAAVLAHVFVLTLRRANLHP